MSRLLRRAGLVASAALLAITVAACGSSEGSGFPSSRDRVGPAGRATPGGGAAAPRTYPKPPAANPQVPSALVGNWWTSVSPGQGLLLYMYLTINRDATFRLETGSCVSGSCKSNDPKRSGTVVLGQGTLTLRHSGYSDFGNRPLRYSLASGQLTIVDMLGPGATYVFTRQ